MSAYSVAVLADSPDVYYRLDETSGTTFVDQVAANNLTANATVVSQPSLLSQDADLATTLDSIGAPVFFADSTHVVSQETLSVEFWVKPLSLLAFSGLAACVCSCGGVSGWGIKFISASGIWRYTKQGVADYDFTTSAVAAVGTTQHVVFVSQASHAVDLYINGVFQQTITSALTIGATAETFSLGHTTGATQYPSIVLDEVAVYKSALSATSILAHYTAATTAAAAPRNVAGWITRSGGY